MGKGGTVGCKARGHLRKGLKVAHVQGGVRYWGEVGTMYVVGQHYEKILIN